MKDNYLYNPIEMCPNKNCKTMLKSGYKEAKIEGFPYKGKCFLTCPVCGWNETYACFMCLYNPGTGVSDYCLNCLRSEY